MMPRIQTLLAPVHLKAKYPGTEVQSLVDFVVENSAPRQSQIKNLFTKNIKMKLIILLCVAASVTCIPYIMPNQVQYFDDPSFYEVYAKNLEDMPTLKLRAVGASPLDTKKSKKTKEVVITDPAVQIETLKTELEAKLDDLESSFDSKMNSTMIKYLNKIATLAAGEAMDPSQPAPDYEGFETEEKLKIQSMLEKQKLKIESLLAKYSTKIAALQAQIDASNPKQDVEVIPLQPGDSSESEYGFDHDLIEPVPTLQLPKVKTTVKPTVTTPKVPTMADAYWSAFGPKIAEIFNKSKTTTEASDVVAPTDEATDGTVAPTPLPATFWMTFGKTMGKAFADAKFKIMTAVKATTPAPMYPIDDALVDGPTTEFVVDDTFWDEFGQSLGDALAGKAAIEAAKTTTADPTESLDFTHDLVESVPVLKLADPAATTPVTIPGLYWKTFGDTIKTSFNKSKTVTTDPTTGEPTATPVPPTFWMSFGKTIGQALADAKFKLVSVTKPVIPTPAVVDPTLAGVPVQPIDETFWQDFGDKLDSAIQAKNAASTPIAPVDDVSHDLPYEAPKLFATALPSVPLTQGPVSPGLYWKSYGDQISSQFNPLAQAPYPMNPGLYWKGYGDQISGQFINAKGQVIPPFAPMYYYPPTPFYGPTPYSFPHGYSFEAEDDVPSHSIPNQAKLNLRMTKDSASPWGTYGAGIKSQFQDAKMRTYDDVNRAKFEQPIFDVNEDISTFPAKQADFWSVFGGRVKDNFNKAKASVVYIPY